MTPAARLQATLELLEEIEATPRPADALVSGYFRARRYIGSHDRAAVSTRLYSILRHHARLGWWLAKHKMPPSPRLRLLLWAALGEKIDAPVLDELYSGGKFAPAPLSDEERAFARKITGGTLEHPDMPDDIKAECPLALLPALRQRFGADFMKEMRAMQVPAPLDLRVNTLKATRDEITAELEQMNLNPQPCALSPWGVRLYERPSLGNLSMLKDGRIEIQDEGSQMVAAVVDARPGELIVDFCAGAGGKTLALGAMMENKGRITACDVMERRLAKSSERFRRAGLHNVELRPLSSERDPWVKRHKGGFDRVLADAPCTGTGTWRRNPDTRWRALGPDLAILVKLQAEILDSAARLVKPGGRLIYSTCSLLPDENEKQIEAFLASHADFSLRPCGLNGEDYLALTPARNDTDGFFAAVMVKA